MLHKKSCRTRACLKNHSCNLHAPLCGTFVPNSVVVARYDALIRDKFPQTVTHILQKAFSKHALDHTAAERNYAAEATQAEDPAESIGSHSNPVEEIPVFVP